MTILDNILDTVIKRREEIEVASKVMLKATEVGEEEEVKIVRAKWEQQEIELLIESYIELEKLKPMVAKYYELIKDTVEQLHKKIGCGSFQDKEGTVYQIQEVGGKFVFFEKYTINRTKRPGEERGSLAMSKATELGFSEATGKILFNKALENFRE